MKQLIFPMREQYEEYLIDESKFSGRAESISFPENEEEIQEILRELGKEKIPVTVQGGKTGITGGAVPLEGHVMNLSKMNHVKGSKLSEDGTGTITVEPGMNLMDLHQEIQRLFRRHPLFWPPDPTETSASVGGAAAANAQGITKMLYGSTADYIERLRLIDYAGTVTEVKRGQKLRLPDGEETDFLNAVLGKEGITGIISELTLRLIPKPENMWGISFFFSEEEQAAEFVDWLKEHQPCQEKAAIAAVEYIDRSAIDLIEQRKSTMTKIKELPDVPESAVSMIYIEIHGTEEGIESIAEVLMEESCEYGSDPEEAWAVSGELDVEKMHAFRHGAAETVNLFIEDVRRNDERITKLGTDMLIADLPFSQVLACCRKGIKETGLKGCIFGHAVENHLHVNLLPADNEEYMSGMELIRRWAKDVEAQKGKMIGEHGVGKLKQRILGSYLPESYIAQCRKLKESLDKEHCMNRGNIFQEGAENR